MDADLMTSIALGIGLAAATGLRIFVPLLVLSVAAATGRVELSPSLAWIGSTPALVTFAVATVIEVAAYHVPWVDNALDWLGAPVAVVAGTLVAASSMAEVDPLMRWSLGAVLGGATAGTVHVGLALLRKASSLLTLGTANPGLAAAEAGGSLVVSVLAVLVPLLALAAVVVLALLGVRLLRRRRRRLAAGGSGYRPNG